MIDLDDWIWIYLKNGKRNRRYHDYCKQCGVDKGYIRKNRLNRLCHVCNALSAKKTGKNWGDKPEILDIIKQKRILQVMTPCLENTKQKISRSNKETKRKQQIEKHGFLRSKPQKRLRKSFSSLIGTRLRNRLSGKSNKSSFELVGYSLDDLILHLESKFEDWMTWDNYGKYSEDRKTWQIDHITPDAAFNYTTTDDEDFQLCWELDNLQPLSAKENLNKSDRRSVEYGNL